MPPRKYNNFMQGLISQVRLLEAKEQDLKNTQNVINAKPKTREISITTDNNIVLTTACLCGLASLIATGAFFSGKYAIADYQTIIYPLFSGCGGFFVGSYLGSIGTWSYEKRPVSRLLNKIKLKTLAKKIEKTNIKLENKKYLQDLLTKDENNQIFAQVGDIVITKQEATDIMVKMFEDYLKENYSKDADKIKIINAKEYLEEREKDK